MTEVIKKDVLLSRFSGKTNTWRVTLRLSALSNILKIKYLYLCLLGLLPVLAGFSQQSTLVTHYMFTGMSVNPGYAGGNAGINVTGVARQQWMGWKDADGIKSAPQTYLITLDAPVRKLHGGLGGSVTQDQIGAFKNTVLKLGYAYRTEALNGDLSIGLQGSLQSIGYDASKFNPITEGDPVLGQLEGKKSDMILDACLGVYYSVPEKYYLGLSAENLIQTKGKKTNYRTRRTFYLEGGYHWTLPNHPAFEVQPVAQIMFDGAVVQLNAGALVTYNNKIFGGLNYRYQDAVSVLAGVLVKGLRIGVAYDIGTSALRKYHNGGLEVMLNYCFKIDTDKFRKTYRNTRFL
ncbi:MAG TPA: PorP/SprF family type IX secretion system membrane protein [Bacteroidales bacterium]|nr:PorP/SprF family type IX secretion system membrane protein [Bacteroidales bacterium]